MSRAKRSGANPAQASKVRTALWAVSALAASLPTAAFATPKEVGVWIDDTGKGAVKIEICGNTLCGKIVWLKEPLNDKGEPKTDKYNPDPAKQTRPICGLPTLGGLQQMAEGGFDNGWVYDPKEGKSYSVALDLAGPDKLQVTGYKGMRFLGKSFIWTRAQTDLPTCDTTAAQIAPPAGAKPGAKTSAGAGEQLPWGNKSTAAPATTKKAPASASKLGASNLPSDQPAKKTKPAAKVIPQPPAAASY